MGQVLDPSRSLGMTGGWEVGGEAITRDCTYAGTPPAHTSTGSARAAPPVGMASRHRRTYNAGPRDDRGVGGGWGGNHAGLHLCGHPPAHTSRASARAAPPLGMASRHRRTYSAGPRDDRGVGGGWGGNHAGLHLCGHPPPPAHTSTGSAHGIALSGLSSGPVGMASRHRRTYSAGPRDDRGVGGGWGVSGRRRCRARS